MKNVFYYIGLLTFLALFCIDNSYANPMLKKKNSQQGQEVEVLKSEVASNSSDFDDINSEPSFLRLKFSQLLMKSIVVQRQFSKKMNYQIKDIKVNKNYTAVFVIMFFGFLYGIVHALGPGHGKVIISSYFLSKKAKIKDGVLVGLYTAFTHGISAIIFVSILNLTLRTFLTEQQEMYYIKLISYSLIFCIGLYLFIRTILEQLGKVKKHEHCHSNNGVVHSHFDEHLHKKQKNKEMYILSIITGMIPCVGSMLILLYTMSQGLFWLGVLAILSISLGISVTLISFGLIAIFMRKMVVENKLSTKFYNFRFFEYGARYVGALLITVIGGFLFLGV